MNFFENNGQCQPSRSMRNDGRTDTTELIVACRHISNVPSNENFGKVTKSPGRKLNPRHSEYEEISRNQLWGSVKLVNVLNTDHRERIFFIRQQDST